MPDLPRGTVAFVFTDIEGSTTLWERDRAAMAAAVERHFAILRETIAGHNGVAFKTVGDAVQAAFATAADALAAAVEAQQALVATDWGAIGPLSARVALHAGTAFPEDGDYLAPCLNRLSRLLSTGYGGQILLSDTLRRLLEGSVPTDVSLRDLGEHRLRDLLEPERVWQVLAPGLPDQFPPLRTLKERPHNLPSSPTPLLGRERELAALLRFLREEDRRLVTLTGPGGSGKTRLALEAAAELLETFPNGVWFLDLAAMTNPNLLLPQIATTLGVRESGERPLIEQLASALSGQRLLLVLDNLEQFRPFVEVSRAIADLLAAVPGLSVLVTSRAALRLRMERELPVPPLPVPTDDDPSPEDLAAFPAVQLFVARAAEARPGFALSPQNAEAVAALCQRLDGLPLAIELAAARVRALSPADILERLGGRLDLLSDRSVDRPDRQRTLEATIGWSHDLLGLEEQAAFRRLAVFSGGWTLPAAEAVLGAISEPTLDVLTGLEVLVEQGLVVADEQADGSFRYRMLETVRAFGLERLHESGEEEAARQAHAEHFATLGIDLEREFRLRPVRLLVRLAPEIANLRSALSWAEDQQKVEIGLLLAIPFVTVTFTRGQIGEGAGRLRRLLTQGAMASDQLRARALVVLAWQTDWQGDTDTVERLAEQAKNLAGNDLEIIADAVNLLGIVAMNRGDSAVARGFFEEALSVARTLPDPGDYSPFVHASLGQAAMFDSDLGQAREWFEAGLAALSSDEHQLRPMLLGNLAWVVKELGDPRRAAVLEREALIADRALGSLPFAAEHLESIAEHAASARRWETAACLLATAEKARQRSGAAFAPGSAAAHDRLLSHVRKHLGDTAFTAAWLRGESLSLEQAIGEAERALTEIAASNG